MPKTVLLADDSVTIQKVVGISFASEDVTLVTVDNGDDAITKAREVRPDVILADVVMPGKNGYEVCEAIKGDPALRHIPVLLLTGTFEAFDEERARAAGAAAHVAKPFEAQTLIDQVNRLLAERAAAPAPMAAPPRVAAPAPMAAPPTRDDAFDFFDDDMSEVADSESSPETRIAVAEPLDLESPEPFAFGDDSFGEMEAEEPTTPEEPFAARSFERARAGDMTVAILGDDEPLAAVELEPARRSGSPRVPLDAQFENAEAVDFLEREPAADRFGAADPDVTPADDIFDFDFERSGAGASNAEAILRVDSSDLAQATMLDPEGAGDFDVSVSDLGEPPPVPVGAPRATAMRPDREVASEPREWPEAAPIGRITPSPSLARPPATAHVPDPVAQAEAALARVSPALKEQIHATLEKVAWDALGNLSEEIVRKAVERVEHIAWEVIPQMAETLVREEIRRMQGDED